MRRVLLQLLVVLLLTLGMGSRALAHATLQQARPQPDITLDQAPARVELTFTEEVEAGFGAIAVYDHTGARVDKGDAALDPTNVTRVLASLPVLGDGLYTVSWRVLSADGHPISGTYGFTVGQGIAGATYFQPELPDPDRPPLGVLVGYWLAVAGLMAATGLSLAQGLMGRGEAPPAYRRLLLIGLIVAGVGSCVYLISRTAQVAGVSVAAALNPVLVWRLLMTVTGRAVLARLVLLAAATTAFPLVARRWWLVAMGGALGLLTFPLSGHASAVAPAGVAVVLDWIHLLAAATWGGGLVYLLLVLVSGEQTLTGPTGRMVQLGALVRRFSAVAAASVLLLVGTGLYPTLLHVPSMKALLETLYGLTLRSKFMLVAVLIALGAVNLIIIGPRLRRGQNLERWLKGLVAAELAVVAGVLAATALLTNVAPARVALPPEKLSIGMHTQDYAAVFRMDPLAPGYRVLNVVLGEHDGTPLPDATKVGLTVTMINQDVGKQTITGRSLGEGKYQFDNVLIGMPGTWLFELQVQEPGAAEPRKVKLDFEVPEK
ncbi:MAG: copper resistance protein CopC [Symbiobacteriaceae bacterium]|jgi:copper transport protein|nr:copper resistance protein CopC [Symbiobacteriaceae bacterium]